MKNILLTGGTGYLGSKILKQLVDQGNNIVLLKRSHSNTEKIQELLHKITVYEIDRTPLETVFCENPIDIIVHCATDYGRDENNPLHVVETNFMFPLALLESGKKHGIQCFINTDTILDRNTDSYSLSKKQFKEWLCAYKENFSCINVSLEHFYGPGNNPKRFVTFVVRDLINNVERIDLTKGEQIRDFVYIDDVVAAFLKIIDSSDGFAKDFYEFEVGTNHPLSIRDFVNLAQKLSGNTVTSLNFGAVPYRKNETMKYNVDTSRMCSLGWKCMTPIAEGLRKMIAAEKHMMNRRS